MLCVSRENENFLSLILSEDYTEKWIPEARKEEAYIANGIDIVKEDNCIHKLSDILTLQPKGN